MKELVAAACLRVGGRIVHERSFGADADVRIGGDSSDGPGLRVNMCGEGGEDHLTATYEELVADGAELPIEIGERRINVRVRDGISVFAKFVTSA